MTRQAACVVVVVLLTVPALSSGGQEPPPQSAGAFRTIRGEVLANDVGETPLRRVRILLAGQNIASTPSYTDANGRFEIAVPDATTYSLTFTKAGFAPQVIQGTVSVRSTELRVRLARGAAITGRVVDQYGDPLAGRVRVRRLTDEAGLREEAREWTVECDDLGEFRAGSLPAGRYEVIVDPLPLGPGSSEPVGADRAPAVLQLAAGEEATLALVEEVTPTDPRGVVIGGSRTPIVEDGATIRGRIVGTDSRPVGGAFIALSAGFQSARQTASDVDGTFQFVGLPPNTYRMSAVKLGASLAVAARDLEVAVRQKQLVDGVTIMLARLPAVTGTVLDENGEPVEGVTVELLRSPRGGGRRLLQRVPAVHARRTDDRGRYRLFPAEAGEHYVAASAEPQPLRGATAGAESEMRMYYPGRLSVADALTVRVVAGQDAQGIDIDYVPTAGARVYGHALDSSGQALTRPITLVESIRSGRPTMAPRQARVRDDGAFSFVNVPPGDYVLQGVVRPSPERPSELGLAFVGVAGADGPPVTLRTSGGTTVRGHVELEGDASNVRFDSFGLRAVPSDLDYDAIGVDSVGAGVLDDGTFEMRVQGPMRLVPSVAPRGWWLKSARIGAADAAEEPYTFGARGDPVDVVVVFSDATAEVSGRVRDDRGQSPARGSFVLVFPTDESRWYAGSRYVTASRATADGSFGAILIPPGDYWMVAVDQSDSPPDLGDADVLRSLVPRAQRVSAGERQRVARTLPLPTRLPTRMRP